MANNFNRIIDWMRWGASQFQAHGLTFGHGTDNAWDEAVYLVLNALHLPPEMPVCSFHSKVTPEEQQTIHELLRKRIQTRKPAAYLTHEIWFGHLRFYVDERVIVPRSPFAEVLEQHVPAWLDSEQVTRVLDIGTGSGCIAVLSAMLWPHAEVVACDTSQDALTVAQYNVQSYQLTDRVQLVQSDLFEHINDRFDLIISNPPYVSETKWQQLPEEYHHEPSQALVAADGGLGCVKRILQQASDYLTQAGILILEVGLNAHQLAQDYPDIPFVWLDLERGGEGVCLLTKAQLDEIRRYGR